jgi:hypothetical protein
VIGPRRRLAIYFAAAIAVASGGSAAQGQERAPRDRKNAPAKPREARDTVDTAIVSVRVAIETGSRDFSYTDRITPTLRPYSLFAAPLVAVDAELYPLARTGIAVLKDFGATFDASMAFDLSSATSSGTQVSTSWSSFGVGARERIHLGRAATLGLHGGYGEIAFSFDAAPALAGDLPDVHYRFLQGGLDARLWFGAFSIYASGSYLGVLSTGLEGTYFPRATAGGVQASIGVAYALGYGFELSLAIAYTRFFYTMNPQPGDAYVAGGALDQLAQGSLGVAYAF